MPITYRLHEVDDLTGIQKLWMETAGWGKISDAMWQHYFVDAPYGEPTVVVATDDAGDIFGEFVFVPAMVSIRGRTVRAFRPGAPIVSRTAPKGKFSLNPLDHPAARMYLFGLDALRARGDALLYMMPDPHWVPFLRLVPGLQTGKFPLFSMPLPLERPMILGDGYVTGPLERWDERVDALWNKFSRLHSCQIVRDARSLSWRIGTGQYTITAVERAGELVGLVASRHKGDRQWLVCELLVADDGDSLGAALTAACGVAHARALADTSDRPIHKISVLATTVMEPVVRGLGFVRDRYDFPFFVHLLDKSIDPADIAPASWFLSPND